MHVCIFFFFFFNEGWQITTGEPVDFGHGWTSVPGPLHFCYLHSQPPALQQTENEHSLHETVLNAPIHSSVPLASVPFELSSTFGGEIVLFCFSFSGAQTVKLLLLCYEKGKSRWMKQTIDYKHACLHHRCFKRHSRAALNRQQELSHLPIPPQLRLYDYLQRRKERKPAPVIDLKISKVGNVSSQHLLILARILIRKDQWRYMCFALVSN